ncbi:putative Importin subunit beta-1 [Blattamonas nauphoetae]|uniref:Importin subunit beta-1 n=1 Tax=Blattamonas nauphoetae TaxID=2049346 RepID=A0ABQ9YG89_9EUKA|nr:putative Importin subunit beta-1 [Blattamonas nauphoetae]
MKLLFDEFQDPSKTENSRNIALVLLTRCLTSPSPSRRKQQAQRWLETFNEDARNVMKGALINTLATASRGISRSAARVASLIAVIEIPCGQWDDFFTIMEQNLGQQANPNAYHAFLTCLGYTCQDLDKSVEIKKSYIILRSVCPFIDPERGLELNEVAINALNNSIEFCQRTFTNNEERHTLVNLMINSCNSASEQVRAHAYECLIKSFGLFYPLLDTNNFSQLFDMVVANIQRETESLFPSVLEIWIVIAEVENTIKTTKWYPPRTLRHSFSSEQLAQFTINRPQVIFHNACQHLFQPLFPLLCHILQSKPDDYDTPSWDKFHSTAFLIQMFVKVRGDEVADQIVNFVNEHIRSEDWHKKDTSLQLLGCIFVGTTRNNVIITIKSNLEVVFHILRTDPSLIVRDTAAWLLNKIIGNLPEVVNEFFPQFLEIIKQGLHPNNSPFIRGQITMAFKSIVKNNLENQNCLAMLVADFRIFNELIVENVINAPNQMFLDKVLSMNQDLMFSIPRQQETMLLSVGTAMMKNIENNLGNLSPVTLTALLSLLADFSIPLGEKFNVLSTSFGNVLLQLMNRLDASLIEPILDFLQILAVNLRSSFSQHYVQIFPFVLNCFQLNVKAVQVKVTLLVGDIATGITPQLVHNIIPFIKPVLSLLDRVDEYGLEVIDNVLSTLSLIALQVQDKFEDFLEPTLNNVSNACLQHVSDDIRVGIQLGSIVGMEEKLREVQHLHESALESFSYLIAAFSKERSPKCRDFMIRQAYTICQAVSVCLLEGLSPIISPSGELFESIGKINATQFDFVQYPVLERSGVRTLTDLLKSGIVTQNTLVLAILVLVDIFVLLRQDDPRCVVSGVPLEFVYLCRGALNSGIFPQDVIRHIHEGIDSMLQFLQRQKGF